MANNLLSHGTHNQPLDAVVPVRGQHDQIGLMLAGVGAHHRGGIADFGRLRDSAEVVLFQILGQLVPRDGSDDLSLPQRGPFTGRRER